MHLLLQSQDGTRHDKLSISIMAIISSRDNFSARDEGTFSDKFYDSIINFEIIITYSIDYHNIKESMLLTEY